MTPPPVFPTLMALFAVVLIGRSADGLIQIDAHATEWVQTANRSAPQPREFSELDAWEEELMKREQDVEARAIASDIALAEARRQAQRAVNVKVEKDEQRISKKRMVAVYAAMDPIKAAGAISGLSDDKAANLIAAMNPDVAGAILSAMPTRASQAVMTAMVEGS
ncbi:MAG: hypothetical protein AAF986_00710 [Pseudomonadota bacterium]